MKKVIVYSNTAIGKMLGINRKTIGKILKENNGDKPIKIKERVRLSQNDFLNHFEA